MIQIERFILGGMFLAFVGSVFAAPSQVTQAQFNTLIAAGNPTIENFEGFAVGASPSTIANGVYSGGGTVGKDPWCSLSTTNKCLTTGDAVSTFSRFPSGTTAWGVTIYYAGDQDQLQVVVVGKNETSLFTLPPGQYAPGGTFVGFVDTEGLTSVTFSRVSEFGTNQSYDDVTTASLSMPSVPAPALSNWLLVSLSVLLLLCTCVYERLRLSVRRRA